MNYADKIMNTEYYQKLKRVGNKIVKSILYHPNEQGIAKNIPMKYLDLFYEFSLKVKELESDIGKIKSKPASFCQNIR